MTDIEELIRGMKSPFNRYNPLSEDFFMEHRLEQMKKIRKILENPVTFQKLEAIDLVMRNMWLSEDLAKKFPKIWAYERAVVRYHSDKYKELVNRSKL